MVKMIHFSLGIHRLFCAKVCYNEQTMEYFMDEVECVVMKDTVDKVVNELKGYWRLEIALKNGFMEDVEGAIREAFIRGITYGGMDEDLFEEALSVCEEMDKETDNF